MAASIAFFCAVEPSPLRVPEKQSVAAELLPEDPFSTVGVGWAVEDGESRVVLTYLFDSDAAAESAMPLLERQWAEGISLQQRRPLRDLFTVVDSHAAGQIAVVTLTPAEDGHPSAAMAMLITGEPPFLSR